MLKEDLTVVGIGTTFELAAASFANELIRVTREVWGTAVFKSPPEHIVNRESENVTHCIRCRLMFVVSGGDNAAAG